MLSKYKYYLSKGSNIPNLSYSHSKDEVSDNSLYCYISEENLIRITEYDCSDILKIKCLGLIMEIKRISQTYRGKADVYQRDENWVTLCAKILRENYGTRDWIDSIRILRELDLIEVDSNFRIGDKKRKKSGVCNSYRLTDLAKKDREVFYVKYTGKILEYLNKEYIYSNSFDKDENIINKVLSENMRHVTLCESPENIAEKYPGPEKEPENSRNALVDIHHKQFYLVECKTSGRRFHNFLGLTREARRAILIDGEPCSEVDFSACHPWICYSFYEKNSKESKIYLNALNRGFYYFIADFIGEDVRDPEVYQKFKISCIAQIFYDYPRNEDGRKLAAFQKLFPEMYHIIQAEKHKSNSDFAYKLQKMEADLMFDGVFFGLFQKDIVAIPIHDGVLCKQRDAEEVKRIMEHEFQEKYGYLPKVGEKRLTY